MWTEERHQTTGSLVTEAEDSSYCRTPSVASPRITMPGPTDHDDVDGADHDAADQLIAMRGMRTPVPSRSNHDGAAYQIVAHIHVETTKATTASTLLRPSRELSDFVAESGGSRGFHVAGAGTSVHDGIDMPFELREDVRVNGASPDSIHCGAGICAKRVPRSAAVWSTHQGRVHSY